MKNRLLNNIPAKLFALVVACVLWLHVATEKRYEQTFTYPLIVEGLPNEYVLGALLPDSVSVVLEGRGKDLIKLTLSEGAVVIDASGFKYSEKFYDLTQAELRLPKIDYSIVGYKRKDPLRLVIDRYANKSIPVKSDLIIEPADGYATDLAKTEFDPPEVIVGGPEGQIKLLEGVYTVCETLRNINTTTTVIIDINSASNLLAYVPEKVKATIYIEPLYQKEMKDITVQIKGGTLRNRQYLEPKTINLVFAGTRNHVDSLHPEDIKVFVDYINVPGKEIQVTPIVVHPPEVRVVSMEPEYFKIIQQ